MTNEDEAREIRENHRQEFLDGLMDLISEPRKGEMQVDCFLLRLSIVAIYYLELRRRGITSDRIPDAEVKRRGIRPSAEVNFSVFFYRTILPKIKNFANAEAESDLLVAKLLGKMLASGLNCFNVKLLEAETSDSAVLGRVPGCCRSKD